MSKDKLYAVKNDKGYYWDFNNLGGLWKLSSVSRTATFSKAAAKNIVEHYGGHVFTLIEEPKKVVLTKEQAETVERAYTRAFPALFIAENGKNETLLMEAYVNGYTVAKEKKYNVKVPHTKNVWYYNDSQEYLQTICPANKKLRGEFTEAEIEHYGLQDCEKVEVNDDEQ